MEDFSVMNSNDTKVTYHPLRKENMEDLARVIVDTWQFHEFIKDRKADKYFGLAYLEACLVHSSFSRVAEIDGKAVGIIICTDHSQKKTHFRHKISYLYNVAKALPFEQNNGFDFLKKYGDVMLEMDKACPQKGDAEIKLFIVKEDCRGLGIGLTLFAKLLEYLKENNKDKYYVHTDTACNYSFYESRGMKILEERNTNLSYAGKKNVRMFLYGAELQNG